MKRDDPAYMREYMRPRRAWKQEADAIMRTPPGQRMTACMDLFSRDFDAIMEEGAKRHHALMRRIREAPDAGPEYHVVKSP
jgi:hypothetical protein